MISRGPALSFKEQGELLFSLVGPCTHLKDLQGLPRQKPNFICVPYGVFDFVQGVRLRCSRSISTQILDFIAGLVPSQPASQGPRLRNRWRFQVGSGRIWSYWPLLCGAEHAGAGSGHRQVQRGLSSIKTTDEKAAQSPKMARNEWFKPLRSPI